MLELFRSLVAVGRTREVIRECRNCGTVLEEDAARCSRCDSADIARYEIE